MKTAALGGKPATCSRLVACGLAWFVLAAAPAVWEARAAEIAIPAAGLLGLDEGTLEFWFQMRFDPAAVARDPERWKYQGKPVLFRLGDGAYPGSGFGISILGWDKNICLRFGIDLDGRQATKPMLPPIVSPKREQWYHFAVAWKDGRTVIVYLDGKIVARQDCPESFTRRLFAASTLRLSEAKLAIDDFRLSAVARPPSELGCHGPLQADAATLLLLSFDQPLAAGKLVPDRAATLAAACPLALPKPFALVPGKFGQGLVMVRE